VLAVLLIVAIALITIDFRDGGTSSAHTLGGRIFGPVEHLGGDVTGWLGGGHGAEIAALQRRNAALEAQLAARQRPGQADAQLARLVRLTGQHRYRVVSASVIAAGGDYSDTVTIGAGSAAGIAPDETVLNGDGLVGTIISVSPGTATVQLISDAAATVGIRMTGSGQIGALAGTAGSLTARPSLRLTLFSANATLRAGQTLVTFGSVGGRPYVAGVPVGQVTRVTTEPGSLTPTALVRPYVDFTGLGVVAVVVGS
jgi:rod shape-determining protein MreC